MFFLKVYRFLISLFVHVKYKLIYSNRFICPLSVRLPGSLKIRMNGGGGENTVRKRRIPQGIYLFERH